MNLKLRRLVRTPYSEQFALFDLDQTDTSYDPMSIGKLDLHYTADAIYGTFLLWHKAVEGIAQDQVRNLVEITLQELCEPMGLPGFYAVEFFAPHLNTYALHSNEEEDADAADAG
jgi:hypothetical protein